MVLNQCLNREPWLAEDTINMIQMSAVGCVVLFAICDLFLRRPQAYPERQRREVHKNVKWLLPSLVWRWANWTTCWLWVGWELSVAIVDLEDMHYDLWSSDLPGWIPRVCTDMADDLRMIRAVFLVLLALNGVLCLWASQYYHGVHAIYRAHLHLQGSNQGNLTVNALFFAACPPEAYLSELQGIELILGAADTVLVNMPVLLFSYHFSAIQPESLGPLGHANLFMSISTYILNLWLASDRAPGLDAYRLQFGGWRSPCVCNGTRLGEFLLYLIAFPLCWMNTAIVALPAFVLIFSGFNPRAMCLNWFLPRFSHHRQPGFGHNDAVSQVLNAKRFPGFGRVPQLDVASMPTEGGIDTRWIDADESTLSGPSSLRAAQPAAGFTDEQLAQLPMKRVEEGSDRVCCICLDSLTPGEDVFVLTCSHLQHRSCVEPWLRRRTQCPECRTLLIPSQMGSSGSSRAVELPHPELIGVSAPPQDRGLIAPDEQLLESLRRVLSTGIEENGSDAAEPNAVQPISPGNQSSTETEM